MSDVGRALASRSPLDLLMLVSSLLAALDPRQRGPFEHDDADTMTVSDLVSSLLTVDELETTAVLAVLAELCPDELTRTRIRRELAKRRHRLPQWLSELGSARPHRAVVLSDVLTDGQDIVVGTRLASGLELTTLCLVDFNLGTVAKDGFVLDQPLEVVLSEFQAATEDDPDLTRDDIELSDARARASAAIEIGARTFPPLESDTWPAARPLLEWVLRLLPDGGRGFEYREWSESELEELAGQFFSSPFGAEAAHDADQRFLLDWLIWYGSAYGPGDPLHWSPTAIELALLDAIPRKVVAKPDELAKAPEVLRALIRFSYERRGLRPALTEEALAAVDQFEPEYQGLIRSPRAQGAEALLAVMGALDEADLDELDEELSDLSEIVLASLRSAVGGDAALQALDAQPLPDEPFDWSGIPEDIHPQVGDALRLADTCAEQMFDVEFRTAGRRLLARAAAGDPVVFRRRAKAETAAAAVCWMVAKANHVLDPYRGGFRAKDLMAHFGLSGSVSQRANTLLRAAGIPDGQFSWDFSLNSPAFLTAARRAEIRKLREHYQQ